MSVGTCLANVISPRDLNSQLIIATKYSADSLVIDVTGIESNEPFKVRLLSTCTQSYQYAGLGSIGNKAVSIGTPGKSILITPQFGNAANAGPEGIDADLCIMKPSAGDGNLLNVFKAMQTMRLSLWFDLEGDRQANPELATGELVVGEPNTKRFKQGTSTVFPLSLVSEWKTKQRVTVGIEGRSAESVRFVTFDVGSRLTMVPIDMYNAIVAGLEGEERFACKKTKAIKGFTLNALVVPSKYLVEQLADGECQMIIAPHDAIEKRDMIVGLGLMKQFHTTVNFGIAPHIIITKREATKKTQNCAIC